MILYKLLPKRDRYFVLTKTPGYLAAFHIRRKFKYSIHLFASVVNFLVSLALLGKLEFSLVASQGNTLVLFFSFGKLEFTLFTSLGNSLVLFASLGKLWFCLYTSLGNVKLSCTHGTTGANSAVRLVKQHCVPLDSSLKRSLPSGILPHANT